MKTINGAFITIHNIFDKSGRTNAGFIKKIVSQYSVLEQNFNMRLDIYDSDIKKDVLHKILKRLPFFPSYSYWKLRYDYSKIDFIFIRIECIIVDKFFINFLFNIKKQNNKIIIIGEIPTYPYDMECDSLIQYPFFLKNKINRKKFYRYIDRIVTYSTDNKIFNIKTIKIINGIDINAISVVTGKLDENFIRLIAVANIESWHGYDRLILGLAKYFQNNDKKNIIFDIVGCGSKTIIYQKMIKKYNLDDYVFLHGFQTGERLDNLYNLADIAVCGLGGHRKNIFLSSELKSREYLAKGLPIIASSIIDIIPRDFEYCFYVPEDDSPIDINGLVTFYNKIYNNNKKNTVVAGIRHFAEENIDIKITMRPIIDFIKSHLNNE
jgi:hypothetical protein